MTTTTTTTKKAAKSKTAKATKTAKAPKATTKKAKAATAAKPAKPARAKKEPGPREIKTDTPAFLVRRLIVENPDISIPECERLAQAEMPSIDKNTLRGLYQGAAGFLRVARHLGFDLVKQS
jgi:hypothetical protein